MIKISFTHEGNKLSLRLEGHADYAEEGKDIVCASASILAYTVAQRILELEAYEILSVPPTVKMESGDAVIEAVCEGEIAIAEVMRVMHFAKIGCSLLQASYPEHIKFIVIEA